MATGVDGVDLVIGTSSFLREHSHGKDMAAITKAAIEVINYVKRYTSRHRIHIIKHILITDYVVKESKSDFLLKIPSAPTWSTCFRCTRLSTQLV